MKYLKVAGVLTLLASVTHIAIIFGGADWYRFFGAGEELAVMQEQGSSYPAIVTGVIALVLFVWSLFAFSGAGIIRQLPLTRLALAVISLIFLARGLLALPTVLLLDSPYLAELASQMTFMIVSSAICTLIGVCYAIGTYQLLSKRTKRTPELKC